MVETYQKVPRPLAVSFVMTKEQTTSELLLRTGLRVLLLPGGRCGEPELRQVRVLPRGARVQERPRRPAQDLQDAVVHVLQGQAQLLRAGGLPLLL